MTSTAPIEVLWRPGCPYCSRLRRGLRRAGVQTVEHDIWADPGAAARVRAANGGDETVPTVVIGDRVLVNPTTTQVMAAAGLPARAPGDGRVPAVRAGAAATLVVALSWLALASWRPTTTWHLAPVLTAGLLPWFVVRALRSAGRRSRALTLAAAVTGGIIAAATTSALSARDLLRGPTLWHSGDATVEAMLLTGATTLVTLTVGLALTVRQGGQGEQGDQGERGERAARGDQGDQARSQVGTVHEPGDPRATS